MFSVHPLFSGDEKLTVSLYVLQWRCLSCYQFDLGLYRFALDRSAECGCRWLGVADICCCAGDLNHQTALSASQTLVFPVR